jgi:hypothetical protein
MSLMGIAKFERFFRLSAGLDIDKADLKRYSNFVNGKIYDLLLRGQAVAKANNRVSRSSLSTCRSPKGSRNASMSSEISTNKSS